MCFVLICIALIAAMLAPMLTSMQDNYNAVFAAQEIVTYLHFAKLKAISSNESLRVSFLANNSYEVEQSDGTRIRGPFLLPNQINLNTVDDSDGVTFSGNYVLFQSNGRPPATGDGSAGRVKLISRNGSRIDILVGGDGLIRQTPVYRNASAPF
jgi:Tfp pilus assembly protein FimT